MSSFDNKYLKRRTHNAFLSEDNPGCLLALLLALVSTLIALAR